MSVNPTSSVEMAVSDGSSSNLTASQMRFGRVVAPGPPRNSAKTTSSNEVKNANAPAEISAGRTEGNDTDQNARKNEAPHARAASSMPASARRKAAPTMTITTGMASTVCASKSPAGPPISPKQAEEREASEGQTIT